MRKYEEMKRACIRDSALWACLYWPKRFEELRKEGYGEFYIDTLREIPSEQAVHHAIRGLK